MLTDIAFFDGTGCRTRCTVEIAARSAIATARRTATMLKAVPVRWKEAFPFCPEEDSAKKNEAAKRLPEDARRERPHLKPLEDGPAWNFSRSWICVGSEAWRPQVLGWPTARRPVPGPIQDLSQVVSRGRPVAAGAGRRDAAGSHSPFVRSLRPVFRVRFSRAALFQGWRPPGLWCLEDTAGHPIVSDQALCRDGPRGRPETP